jgi:SAM-dependent methyltransferase
MGAEMFEDIAELYDALIDWPKRLANEEPFYRAMFEQHGVQRVLDVACGTGRHAAMFHSWGLQVEGADVSPAMIARCRAQFGESESLRWIVRAFDQPHTDAGSFDAVVCVGNSLALASDLETAERVIGAMLAALRQGGVCVLQVLNLWHLPDGPCVWQKCKRVTLQGAEHILVKGVHRTGQRGFVDLVDLTPSPAGVVPRYDSAAFLGLENDRLGRTVRQAGAAEVHCFGGFQRQAYDREQSQDLIVVIQK